MAQNKTRRRRRRRRRKEEEHVWCVGECVEVVVAFVKLSLWRNKGNPQKVLQMSTEH